MTPTAHSADATPLSDAEIDRLVALNIMHWFPDDDCPRGYRPSWSINQGQNDGPHYEEWQPSTNIADAWQVLEKFQSTHNIYLVTIEKYRWCCDLEGANGAAPAGGDEHVSEMADTAPRAICLACLAVMQVQP